MQMILKQLLYFMSQDPHMQMVLPSIRKKLEMPARLQGEVDNQKKTYLGR